MFKSILAMIALVISVNAVASETCYIANKPINLHVTTETVEIQGVVYKNHYEIEHTINNEGEAETTVYANNDADSQTVSITITNNHADGWLAASHVVAGKTLITGNVVNIFCK